MIRPATGQGSEPFISMGPHQKVGLNSACFLFMFVETGEIDYQTKGLDIVSKRFKLG